MPKRLIAQCLLLVSVVAVCVTGCTPQGGGGGGDPTAGGQGIPQGTYSGTLQCTEVTSGVTQGQPDTVLSQTTPSFAVSDSFGANGIILNGDGDPVTVGSVGSTAIVGATATATIRSITKSVDQLDVVADATATVNVTSRGQRVMLGVVTAVYEFSEPNTVNVVTEKIFTSNVIDGEYIKIVASCSADLVWVP